MNIIRQVANASAVLGIDLQKVADSFRNAPWYIGEYAKFVRASREGKGREFATGRPYPCLQDRRASSGTASGAYFHQDLLVAQRIWQRSPKRHVDIGSRVDGFVAHLAAFRPVEVVDVRPLKTSARNIHFLQHDALTLSPNAIGRTDSVSCLHALEHFGLGRYGDPFALDGHSRGWEAISSILEPNGWAYLSVPIGVKQRIEFNAHRVFSLPGLIKLVGPEFEVRSFHYIDDQGELHVDVPSDAPGWESSFGLRMGCGILELQKLPSSQ